MDDLQNKLVNIEKGFWDAAGEDGSYYEDNFANEGLMVLPFEGGILDKQSTIAIVKKSPKWNEFTINKSRLLRVSDTKVVLLYEAFGKRHGQEPYRALISSLYINHSNEWYLLLHQQTAI